MKYMSSLFSFLVLSVIFIACQGEGAKIGNSAGDADATQTSQSHPKAKGRVISLNVSQLEKMRLAGVELNLIDVRTPEEIAKGKIPDAVEIDYEADDFEQKIDALQKEKSYIVYCAVGGRSSKAAELMQQKGFKNVFNLEGGYEAWEKEVSK